MNIKIEQELAEAFEINAKIELGLNFVLHNDSRLFFDAQEA